jgi:hypothetical protein
MIRAITTALLSSKLRLVCDARSWARLVTSLFLAWTVFVLGHYYLQLWRLMIFGGWGRPHFPGDASLPFLEEAANRALSGVSGAFLLTTAAVLLGWSIFRLAGWQFYNMAEALPFAGALGIGLFAYSGLGLTALGHYSPAALAALVPGLPLAAWLLAALLKKRVFIETGIEVNWKKKGKIAGSWMWIFSSAVAAGMAFIAALAPEREYDALWYHLEYPRQYLAQGRLVDLPWDYVSLYPMTWELWFGYGLVFGGQTAATLLHYACLPLISLVVFLTARRFVHSASPWLAVALFVTIPTVLWEASTAYIDLALALYVSLALYALLCYLEGRQTQWLLLGAVNLGLALASKHLSLIPFGLAGFGLVAALRRQGLGWKSVLLPAAALGVLAMLPALPWYLRSYLASGNPVFPELYWLFGAPAERWDAHTQAGLQNFLDQFGRPFSLWNILTLPWHMTIHAADYHGTLGPLYLILLPFFLLVRLRSGLRWLALFVLFYLVLWASPLSSLQMRFVVPLAPILAVLGAAAFARLQASSRLAWGRRAPNFISAGILGLLLLNLPPFTALHERDRVEWEGWLNSVLHGVEWGVVVGAESSESYLSRQVRSFTAWSYANQHVPQDARLLTYAGGDQFYAERNWIWAYSTMARDAAWPQEHNQASHLPGLARLRITHLLVDRETRERWGDISAGETEWFELLHEDRWYSVYRVRWEKQ